MAKNSPLNLRNLSIYQVYLRNHNKTGTFTELTTDLKRIKDLGFDIVYLLPVHPVGQKHKKGSLGCNYSIVDYRKISEEHGTMTDFTQFIDATHQHDMKVMMDVVFNHTSHDSLLLDEHPEWFYYKNGKNNNRVGDWDDIIDLDFSHRGLWDYLIETLEMYAKMGVDGFRCDVAPLIPLEFWIEARKVIAKINPDFIWLSESVHKSFIKEIRSMGFEAYSDGEMYQAFDILYDYDLFDYFIDFLKGEGSLKAYLDEIRNQEMIYPSNYTKLRNLENHDQERVASYTNDLNLLNNLTAFNFFTKGAAMIYAGEEAYNTHRPSLFDRDPVNWHDYESKNCDDLIKQMAYLKKDPIMANGNFDILDFDDMNIIVMRYENNDKIRYGIFNVSNKVQAIDLNLPQVSLTNLIDNSPLVLKTTLDVGMKPIVFDIIKQ